MLSRPLSRAGFTLLEILVALILLGLLIGAIVPNVLSQASKGEVNRILRDVAAVEAGAKSFRVDVSRWPSSLEQLQTRPTTSSTDIYGDGYPQGLLNRWDGPYLESAVVTAGALTTAAGGSISGFTLGNESNFYQLNDQDYLVITIGVLTGEHLEDLDVEVDGAVGATSGRVHTDSSTAYYLAAPLQ